jgi:hypothetical protein
MPPLPIELSEVASLLDAQALKPKVATRINIDVKESELGLESFIVKPKSIEKTSQLVYFKVKYGFPRRV